MRALLPRAGRPVIGPVFDVSFAHATVKPAQLVAADASGVIGYVDSGPGSDPRKLVTRPEAEAFRAAGLAVGLVHERTASWRSWNSTAANAGADALGAPATTAIYYAADTDLSPGEYSAVAGTLGLMGGRPRGIYGESGLVQYCLDHGAARFGWVAAASAWSHDPAPSAHLRQLVGNTIPGTDRNVVQRPEWGQWSTDLPGETVMLTMVTPPPGHAHAPEVWLADGNQATWVASGDQIHLYQFLGIPGPTQIGGPWFDDLALLPTSASRAAGIVDNFPAASPGGGASAQAVAAAVLTGLTQHPLTPKA